MSRLRKRSPEFGTGRCEWLETTDRAVLAHSCVREDSRVLAVHNLSSREVDVRVALGYESDGFFDLLNNHEVPAGEDGRQHFQLAPYGYLWLREGHSPERIAGLID